MRRVLLLMVVAAQLSGCELPVPAKPAGPPVSPRRPLEAPPSTPILLSETPVPADSKLGCWVVDADEARVLAKWQYPCAAPLPTEKLALPADLDWPDRSLALPALESGEPPMDAAQIEAPLIAATAQEGTAGLLFLPASQRGGGFYVAAWEASNGDAGWKVGLYGAPPASVPTKNGRAYLAAEFKAKPQFLRRKAPAQVTEPEVMVEAPPPPEPLLQSSRRPRALELE